MLVGLGAAGSAGNASAPLMGARDVTPTDTLAVDRDGTAVLRAPDEDVAHGVCPGFAPILLDDDAAGSGGNGVLDDDVAQLACRFTLDRDDCAVLLFSFNTLDPANSSWTRTGIENGETHSSMRLRSFG